MEYLRDTYTYKLISAEKKLITEVRKDFHNAGITHENYITLHFIYENPGITQAELAELNNKDKNVIVKTLDRLEEMGWAKRVRNTDDRRAFMLYITEEGERIIHLHWDMLVERQKEALKVLTEEEQKQLNTLLDKILRE